MDEEKKLTEAWLTNGKCDECRRQKYCSKPCTKNKRKVKEELYEFIAERTGIGPIMSMIQDSMTKGW